jgi:hypothetical protein
MSGGDSWSMASLDAGFKRVNSTNTSARADSADYGKLRSDVWQRIDATQDLWFESSNSSPDSENGVWEAFVKGRNWEVKR